LRPECANDDTDLFAAQVHGSQRATPSVLTMGRTTVPAVHGSI